MKSFPLFFQSQYGIHTERGFELVGSNSRLQRKLSEDATHNTNKEIDKITLSYEKFNEYVSDINDNENIYIKEKHDLIVELTNLISKLNSNCQYCNSIDLFQAQNIMIKIGLLLVDNFDNFYKNNKYLAFNLLETIIMREEFNLNTLSISNTFQN